MTSRRRSLLTRARDALAAFNEPPAYQGASGSPRAGILGSLISQPSAALAARPILARRAAWLIANTPVGQSIANVWTTHLVGDGPSVRSNHPNRAMRRAIESAWGRFYKHADVEGFDLCSLLIRVVLALVADGEAFIRMIITARGELRLQLVPATQIDASINEEFADGSSIIQGIKYDRNGAVLGFYVLPRNPELPFVSSKAAVFVDAADMLHVFEARFCGQRRGISWLHAVMTTLAELDSVEDASVVKARVSAALCGFITGEDYAFGNEGLTTSDTGAAELYLEPGTMRKLRPGETATFSPVSDFTGLNDFLRHVLRLICAGAHVPYELVVGDLSQVNFSSARVGLHNFQRRCTAIRSAVLTSRLLQPVFERVLTLEILRGRLNADLSRDADVLLGMTAMWPQWPQISPKEDTEADALAVANGFRSRQEVVSARGRDVEDVDTEIAADSFRPRAPAKTEESQMLLNSMSTKPGPPASRFLTRDSQTDLSTRDAIMRPNSWNEAARTIEAVVATGSPVVRRDERGAEYDEVLDIAGADLEALRGAHVLNGHQRHGGIDAVIGVVEDAWREGEQLIARMRLSSRSPFADDIAAGVIRSVSIGYEVLEVQEGERGGRRTRTATKWRPREVSFVPVPADPRARTRSQDEPRNRARTIRELATRAGVSADVADDLIDSGATVDQASRQILEAMTMRSQPLIVTMGHSWDSPDAQRRAVGDYLYSRLASTEPSGAARQFAHRSTVDVMRHLAPALRHASDAEVVSTMMTRNAMTTSDFPIVLGDAINRRLGDQFRAAESGASAIAAPGTARDFRPVTEAKTTSFPEMEPLNEDGEIRFGSIDEVGETLRIASYGKAMRISFAVLVNDDLTGITRAINDHALATTRLKAKLILAAMSSTKMSDGKVLFDPAHGNVAAVAAAPGIASLSDGRVAMQKMTPPNDTEPMGLSPAILLVPSELQTRAEQLVAQITAGQVGAVNPFAGRLQVAVEPRLSSALEWYLFAAPGSYPVVRFLTLQGYEAPRFEVAQEFNTLGSSYRLHWHVGAGPVDYRGAWKNAGAAPDDSLAVRVTNADEIGGA